MNALRRVPIALFAAVSLLVPAPALADANADLILAAYRGERTRVLALLAKGASLSARDENGYTALHWAAFRGDVELALLLLDRGAPVDAQDDRGQTPLILAAWNGRLGVVRLLLARGADVARRGADGFQALDYARTRGHAPVVALLTPRVAPTPRPRPTATPGPVARWSVEEEPSPTPEPLPTPEPTRAPDEVATPEPLPAPSHEAGNLLSVVAGVHLSRISFPIVGVHYRRTLWEPLALRVGYETGGYRQPLGAVEADFNFMRLHAALVTTGWLYGGLGATHVILGSVFTGGTNPSRTAYELIGGVRAPLGPLWFNAEGRFGYDGPSTALMGLGYAF